MTDGRSDSNKTPSLRQDAARNRVKILSAALAVFDEEGVDVAVEVIAQRAGVGMGTLYRRFPNKELLIEAVVDELHEKVLASARSALEIDTAANGFAEFLKAVGWLQFEHAGCLGRLWNSTDSEWRNEIELLDADPSHPGTRGRYGSPGSRLRGRDRPVLVAQRSNRSHFFDLSRCMAQILRAPPLFNRA